MFAKDGDYGSSRGIFNSQLTHYRLGVTTELDFESGLAARAK